MTVLFAERVTEMALSLQMQGTEGLCSLLVRSLLYALGE
jgi:hypothetical protein